MIYNENGVILNEEYNILEYLHKETYLDSLLQESITMKDVKRGIAYIGRMILDKLLSFIDFLERLKHHKQINLIKKNKDKISKIIMKMYKEDDYAKVIKGTIAEYLEADGIYQWNTNYDEAVKKVINNPSISKDELEEILYGTYLSQLKNTKYDKKTFFKKENAELITENILRHGGSSITYMAINVEDNIKTMRIIYSNLKIFNFAQNKDEKVSYDVMEELHSYLINGIKSYKNLSTACIELCVKSFNLYNKYNGDMDKVNDEISTYDMSEDTQRKHIDRYTHRYNEIKNPSYSITIEVIKKEPFMIKNIKNPTEEMQLIAVEYNPNYIKFIKNPTEKVLKAVIDHKYFIASDLKDIDLPESMQLIIVSKRPGDIEYIKNPTEKVQLTAVEKDPDSIQYIQNPTDNVINAVAKTRLTKETFDRLNKKIQDKLLSINPEIVVL